MNKSGKIAFGGLLVLVLILTYLEATEPEPVNWTPSYLETDKIPLGSFVFYDSWKETPAADIQNIDIPPFEFLDNAPAGTYFFLNDYVGFDEAELNKLLAWVEEGNIAFISAKDLDYQMLDTLKVDLSMRIPLENFSSLPYLNLVNPNLKTSEPYQYQHETELVYFEKIDTLNQKILGVASLKTFDDYEDASPVFIEAPWGEGKIYLHTIPEAFSNYFLLNNENHKYAEGILAYLQDERPVFWDRYYKSGKVFYTSPLYILLNNRALKWAYYFMIGGVILFLIFEGKRKQRPIPVVKPLENQTVEYSRTIADLFLEKRDYRGLSKKSVEHFYDFIRTRYRVDTSQKNDRLINDLASKSGHSPEETRELFRSFERLMNKQEVSKNEFEELNKSIRTFKKH